MSCMFILFAFQHCHAAVFSDSPRCYYLHLANVLHAGALPERLMAGLSDMREAQPIYTDYHTLRDFVTAFPLSL